MAWYSPLIEAVRDRFGGSSAGGVAGPIGLRETVQGYIRDYQEAVDTGDEGQYVAVNERIAELELALDELGWSRLVSEANYTTFTRHALKRIVDISRIMYLKNPLINRIVEVQVIYVWALPWSVRANHPLINDVVQEFLDDPKNKVELTSHQARREKEVELSTTGNIFLVFFPNPLTGLVRVRSITVDEVDDIITNPDDAREPWFYKRTWFEQRFDPHSGVSTPIQKYGWYPDWKFHPRKPDKIDIWVNDTEAELSKKPETIGSWPVYWDQPVFHIKVGGLPHQKFGMPEVYQALDWARAVKEHLEDWASVWRALSQFAMKIQTTRGARGVQDIKGRLATTIGTGPQNNFIEQNPAPLRASTFISTQGVEIEPMRTQGARNNPEEARMLVNMVAASVGIPAHFFGDSDIGNFATSKTLDRPTELKMRERQEVWSDAYQEIFQYIIDWDAKAEKGQLPKGKVTTNRAGDEVVELPLDHDTGDPIDRTVEVLMPNILEKDVGEQVAAIVNASTLAGHPSANVLPTKKISSMLLAALGEPDIESVIEEMYPEDGGEAEDGVTAGTPGIPAVAPTPGAPGDGLVTGKPPGGATGMANAKDQVKGGASPKDQVKGGAKTDEQAPAEPTAAKTSKAVKEAAAALRATLEECDGETLIVLSQLADLWEARQRDGVTTGSANGHNEATPNGNGNGHHADLVGGPYAILAAAAEGKRGN